MSVNRDSSLANGKPATLCWIEDEPFDFDIYRYHIEKAGYQVNFITSVTEATSKFLEHKGKEWPYLLTIFDINMRPKEGEALTQEQAAIAGVDLLVRFQQLFPGNQCIVVSNCLIELDIAEKKKISKVKQFDKMTLITETILELLEKLQ